MWLQVTLRSNDSAFANCRHMINPMNLSILSSALLFIPLLDGLWDIVCSIWRGKTYKGSPGNHWFLNHYANIGLQSLWADLWILGLHENVATGYGAPAYGWGLLQTQHVSLWEKQNNRRTHEWSWADELWYHWRTEGWCGNTHGWLGGMTSKNTTATLVDSKSCTSLYMSDNSLCIDSFFAIFSMGVSLDMPH